MGDHKPHAANWKPGTSGNPGGRRRPEIDAAKKLGIQIRGDVEGKDGRNKLADRLLKIALGEDDALAMKAIEMLLDRGYGKAKQSLDLRIHDEEKPVDQPGPSWDALSVEERRELLRAADRLAALTEPDDGSTTEH